MRPWIGKLFSSHLADTSAARTKLLSGRRLYRPRLDALEQRLTPSISVQTFGELSFGYTVSPTNTFFHDGTLESTTLPVTVGITQPSGPAGVRDNLPVLGLLGGVTLNLGSGGILPGPPPPIGQPTTGAMGLVSFTSGANGPVIELLDGNNTQLLTSAAHTFDALDLLSSTGTPFLTTEVTPISNPGTAVVTPAIMEPYIVPGGYLLIDQGQPDQETVQVGSVTKTTFTANFSTTHTTGFTIADGGTTSTLIPSMTSSTQPIPSAGSVVVVTPTAMEPYIVPNANLVIDEGEGDQETVTVTSVTTTTFTATFANAHPNGFTIADAGTTSPSSIKAGNIVVTPAVMEPYIVTGAELLIDQGTPEQELVSVISVTGNTFTANFANEHAAGFTINGTGVLPGSRVVTPVVMEPYIVTGAALLINQGQPDQESVVVTSVTAATFTADFAKAHTGAFVIASGSSPGVTTAPQTIAGAQRFTFQNIAITGPATTPIIDLYSNGQGFVPDPSNSVQFSTYSGPLNSSIIQAPPIPLALNQYVQISNAGPLILGPGNPDWSWTPADETFTFGSTTFTSTSMLATYDADLNQLTVSGAGVLFLNANQVTGLHGGLNANQTTIEVQDWNIASQYLPYVIKVDKEEMIVTGEEKDNDGTYTLTVDRGAYGTMAATYNTDTPVIGGINVLLGSEITSTAVGSPGIIVTSNVLTQFELTVLDSHPITLTKGFSFTPVALQFDYSQTTDGSGTHDIFSGSGIINVAYTAGSSSGTLSLALGDVGSPGLVYEDGSLVSVDASITSIGGQGIKIGSVTLVNPGGTFTYTTAGSFAISLATELELPGSSLGKLAANVPVNDEDPITVTVAADTTLPVVPYEILVGDGPYEELEVTNEQLTGTTATLTVIRATNGAPAQDLPVDATVATCVTASGSISFQDGAFDAFSLIVGFNATFAYHGLTITAQNLSFSYTAPDTISLSGTAGLVFTAGGQEQSLEVALGNDTTSGVVIQNGELQSLNATVTAALNIKGLHIAANQLTVAYEESDDDFTLDGSVGVSFTGAPTSTGTTVEVATLAALPTGFSGGATISAYATSIDYSLVSGESLPKTDPYVILVDQEEMEVIASSPQYLYVERGYNGTTATTHQVAAEGQTGAAISIYSSETAPSTNSANLSAAFGDVASGGTDHGIVIHDGQLQSLDIIANGGFSLYGLSLQATAVTIAYDAADDQLKLSGGVAVALTSKFGFAASISNTTPLAIDTATGAFSIPNGLDISGSLQIGSVITAAVTVDYTPDGSSFDLSVTAQVTLANRFTVNGAFSLVDGQLESIALSYSNSTGIEIGTTGLFLTQLGGAVDNLDNPSAIDVSGNISLYGMGTAKVKGYSFITASGTFSIDADELKISGNVSLVGGILGNGSAAVDINWSTGVYSITAQISLFDGIVDFDGTLIFDNEGDVTLSAMADINVPDGVPYIGGETLAGLNFYLQVRPTMADDQSFLAVWTTFALPGVGSVGIGFEYDFDNQLTIIDGPPPEAAAAVTAQTLTVTNSQASGAGSLADAIAQANAYGAGTTIEFDVSSVQLAAPLVIGTSQSVTIIGTGASQLIIDGNGHQVFDIVSGTNVSISGLTIEGGSASEGGGISNSGTLLLSNDVLTGNSATIGGGIWNSGALTLSNCVVYLNTAYLVGGINSTGSLYLSGSTVADNNYTSATPLPLALTAPDIYGAVNSASSQNVIGVADGYLSGISNGDANHNLCGSDAAPINPFRYMVNVLTDFGVGSGVTGDLRYCLNKADAAAAQGIAATIQFASNLSGGTITLTQGKLELTAAKGVISIDGGGGVTVSGAGKSLVFQVNAGATVVLTGLTISDGQSDTVGSGGGIANFGTLTLTHATVSGNNAWAGGGIYNQGAAMLTLSSVTISGNNAQTEGGGVLNYGTLALSNSTLHDNSAGGVGGGVGSLGIMTVDDSIIDDNYAGQSGGGIYNYGRLTLTSSTLSGNSTSDQISNSGYGGGIANFENLFAVTLVDDAIYGNSAYLGGGGISNEGTLTVTNTTISGNSAESGAGILNSATESNVGYVPTLIVSNCTITSNSPAQGPGIDNQAGSKLMINNTIVAGNAPGGYYLPDLLGSASGSNNLIGLGSNQYDGGETGLDNGVNGNQVGTIYAIIDPKLGPLTNNGGPTATMALLPGSPAIGAGLSSLAVTGVAYGASAGATTVFANATTAISAGDVVQIDGQDLQVTQTQSGYDLFSVTALSKSASVGDLVFSFPQELPIGVVFSGANAGATTILVKLLGNPTSIIAIDGQAVPLLGVTPVVSLTVPALKANVSTADPVYVLGSDQRGALRPSVAPDIGAYQSEVFTVNVATDNGASGVGTGSGQSGDLRYCIAQANVEVALGLGIAPTIQFGYNLNGQTITLQNGPLELFSGAALTTINGAGQVTISGGGTTGVFVIDNGARADLIGLTVTDGKASNGGGIDNAGTLTLSSSTVKGNSADTSGGIANTGTLTLTNDTISGNSATNFGGGIFNAQNSTATFINDIVSGNSASQGGGIDNSGTLTLTSDTISGNSASGPGGGIANLGTLSISASTVSGNSAGENYGGGIENESTLTISNSTFTNNMAEGGGAILNDGNSSLTVTSSTFTSNSASANGGAIEAGGAVTVIGSTFFNNSAQNSGGGIVDLGGTVTLISSTLVGNSAKDGGAILGVGSSKLSLTNCTIDGNSASDSGGGINDSDTLTLQNTIVAGNTAKTSDPDISGSASGSNNLVGDGTGMTGLSNGDTGNNRVGTSNSPIDPMLAPLADNGGPTETMEVLSNSPAIGAGVVVTTILTDQRGAPLPTSSPDIGAYQTQVFTVITNTDSAEGVGNGFTGDLRYCVSLANADVANGVSAAVTFAAGLDGQTITTQNGPIELTDASARTTITAAGQGITISGFNFVTLLGHTTSGSNLVSGLSSTSLLSAGMLVTGAGIPVADTIAALGPDADEIQLSAPATATATVSLAFGTSGSVFQIDAGTQVVLNGLTISNGNAALGGGINNAGALTLLNATISGNFANSGGGIYNTGALTLSNSSFSGNTSISGGDISGPGSITGAVNIDPATPIISSINPVNITYGSALDNSQLSGTATWTVGGVNTLLGGIFTYTSASGTVLKAGNGQIENVTFTPADSVDYAPATAQVMINVNPAVLTVTANVSQAYGSVNPAALAATITGFVNGDQGSLVSGSASLSTTASSSSDVGTYTINVAAGTLSAANYTFAVANGTLTIDPAALTITADDQSMVYGGTRPALTASYSSLVNGDTASAITGLSLTTVPATSHAGSYAITVSGASDSDYAISFVNGTLTIDPAALTITADDQSMVYGGAMPTLTASYSSLVNGDTPSAISGLTLATVPATSHAGSYAITVSGASDSDYAISFVNGTLTIDPATLTITANNQSMVYGGTRPTLTASYSSLVNGDTAGAISGLTFTTVPVTSHVGSYAVTASGASDSDYAITFVNGTLTIDPAALTITANNQSMVYGGTMPALTASYSSLVNGDTASAISGLTLATVLATSHAGSYAITASGGSDSDYAISFVNGTLTINPAPLTISADTKSVIASGILPALTASYIGLVNGDTAASLTNPVLSTTATPESPPGSYSIAVGGAFDPDYMISYKSGTLTITSPMGISNATTAFVTALYQDVLDRAPDSNGLVFWGQVLTKGASRKHVVRSFWDSKEHRTLEVESYYASYLDRQADAAGLAFWVNKFEHGKTENQVIAGILTSPEYRLEHSTADSLIKNLYSVNLGRAPKPAALAYWERIDKVPNLGRKAVVERILTSVKSKKRDIRQDDMKYLGYTPEKRAYQSWLTAHNGATVSSATLARALLSFDEFFAHVTTPPN
jgi:hypothetical protein